MTMHNSKSVQFLIAALLFVWTGPVLAKRSPVHVSGIEVSLKKKKMKQGEEMVAALRKAIEEEAAYYDDASSTPVVMRVEIQSMSFRSDGKAALQMVPIVGAFAGANENKMKAKVQLVDPASGKVSRKFTIKCNDQTVTSTGKEALGLGLSVLSAFVPMAGMIADTAVAVGEAALEKRVAKEDVLTRGFTMLAFRKIYDGKAYKNAQKRKKEMLKAAAASKKAAIVPVSVAATPLPEETVGSGNDPVAATDPRPAAASAPF